MPLLHIENLHAHIDSKEILKGLSLDIEKGSIHAIMGPNGSGKSTFSNCIMGNPIYKITSGTITWNGKNITDMAVHERAKEGIFMAFQYPREITGVTFLEFLRNAYVAINTAKNPSFETPSIFQFKKMVKEKMKLLKIESIFLERYVNQGFSGGEKKKAEMLQLALLNPKLAILDETDSGLDVDALKVVAQSVNNLKKENPELTVLIITHYQRILDYITPDYIQVMVDGKIVKSGTKELGKELEKTGYTPYLPQKKEPSLTVLA